MKRNILAKVAVPILVFALIGSFTFVPHKARAVFNGVLPVASLNTTPDPVIIGMTGDTLFAGQSTAVTFTFPVAPEAFTTSNITAPNGTISDLQVTGDPKVYIATYTPDLYINDATNTISVSDNIGSTTYASGGSGLVGISFDGTNMWAANGSNSNITKFTPLGVATTYASTGLQPFSLAFDGTNMWTGNNAGGSVSKVTAGGSITTYSSIGNNVYGIAFDGTNMWTSNFSDASVSKVAPNGSKTTYTGTGTNPWGIAFDGTNMWTANYGQSTVSKIAANGTITTYPVSGMSGPMAIAYDGTYMWTGNVNNDTVSRISSDGTSTTYSSPASIYGLAYDGINMWGVTYGSDALIKIAVDGTMTRYTFGGGMGNFARGIAFDGTNMWTANYSGTVSKITNIGAGVSANFTVDTRTAPTLLTSASSGVQSTSANISGNITVTGGADLTARGFHYGKTTGYGSTVSASDTLATGNYSTTITGLECGTTYHYRSFATNSIGTETGSDATFTTQSCGGGGAAPHVVAAASENTPLDFSVLSATASQATIKMNASAATVTGFIASTDPTFSGTWIKPYPADGIATVDLSGATGSAASQSIYLKYVSMTGHQSDVMSRPFSKTGAGAAST
ncbi:MAG: hypothetical protein KBC67_03425, partial [Candidatus Pacebacteria bacterium]|nr:hypothetical protein [Candidatus Paceibacterota bacterium]